MSRSDNINLKSRHESEIVDESIPDYSESIDAPGSIWIAAASLPDNILREQVEIEFEEHEYQKHVAADKVWRCLDCKLFLFSEEQCSLCLDMQHNVSKLNSKIKYETIPDLKNYKHWNCNSCNRTFHTMDAAASCYANNHEIKLIEKLPKNDDVIFGDEETPATTEKIM